LQYGATPAVETKDQDWTHYLAAGTLIAGGALMVAGHRRAGLALAATGAAMALLEEQEAIKSIWENLPSYLHDAQDMLDKVEGYMNQAVSQGHKIQSLLRR
jgi:ABC-type transporter Mla subunit MlaD